MKKPFFRFSPFFILILVMVLIGCGFLFYGMFFPGSHMQETEVVNPVENMTENGVLTPLPKSSPSPTLSSNLISPDKEPSKTPGRKKSFDYFILALSWSPNYCYTNDYQDDQQCSIGKKLGFVLHGLWPQYENGYPSNCSTQKISREIQNQFPDLYPNDSLLTHEWEKHGTCSGLTSKDYLTLTQQLKQSITIPDGYKSLNNPFRTTSFQLIEEFKKINPGLSASSMVVNCSGSGRYLSEIYICYTTGGEPRSCGTDIQKQAIQSCNRSDFLVRNSR